MTKWIRRTSAGAIAAGFANLFLLMAGVSSAEDTADGWSSELALSIAAQSGTTDTFLGSVDAGAERDWNDTDLVKVRFTGVYGTSRKRRDGRKSTETIQNAQSLVSNWKHRIQDRFFWSSGTGLARDNIQDLELRVSLETGPGYRIWMGEEPGKSHFDFSGGLGYRYEIYDGNTGGTLAENGETNHFADLVTAFEYKNLFFEDRVEYSHTASLRVPANDFGSFVVFTEMIFAIPLTKGWSFRTVFYLEYVAEPGADEVNNTTTRTSVGLGYKF